MSCQGPRPHKTNLSVDGNAVDCALPNCHSALGEGASVDSSSSRNQESSLSQRLSTLSMARNPLRFNRLSRVEILKGTGRNLCIFVAPQQAQGAPRKQPRLSNDQVQPHTSQNMLHPRLSQAQQADHFVDFLYQMHSDDSTVLGQYDTQLGLHRLGEAVHTQSEQSQKAVQTVSNCVRDILEYLGNMDGTLKGTAETAEATRTLGKDERRRRVREGHQKRSPREQAADGEVERSD